MKAIVIHAPHDLRVEEIARPISAPAAGEVLVRMAAGGICGSDLHYYHHGGFGVVRVREPMILGHEASGFVEALGAGVSGLRIGDLVAVNPSKPCNLCEYCAAGMRAHCSDMRFNGSAMRMPHEQGLFRECISVGAERAVVMPEGIRPAEAALCEPFAVCLHAASHAGDLAGKTVLVSGSGPIGILCIVIAKLRGAARILATDIARAALDMAASMGATDCFDVSGGMEALSAYGEGKGRVDVVFECSGNPRALAGAIPLLRPLGTMVLVGIGGDTPLPINLIVAKELRLFGTFRFDREFNEAAELIGKRRVDLSPMISAVYPIEDAVSAFEHAGDRMRATKVAIALSDRAVG
ncbi:Tdh Threonine dehydrogenase and related Zn-dependent dehydrogenases [Rhabdaerophilaceae bacterium]